MQFFKSLFGKKNVETELEKELQFHLDMETEENIKRGLNPTDARNAALRKFGGVEQTKEQVRELSSTRFIETFIQDVRFGARMLLKKPAFTIVALLALILGIGANSAIFSVINTVLLQPLPYREPERLMMVWEDARHMGFPRDTPSPANYIDWRDQNKVFEGMAAMADKSINLTGAGEPLRLEGLRVSYNIFQILGVEPILGRSFLAQDDRPESERVVIISNGLWQSRFGADANVIGKTITLDGQAHTVIGIMPRYFQFPEKEISLWVPMAFSANEAQRRGSHYLRVLARLKPGVSQTQAQAEMDTIAARLQQAYPDSNAKLGVEIVSLNEQLVGDIRPLLLVLFGAVIFVLLIACANVANLLLSQATVRQREIAIRSALGAGRLRLIRQFITESLLLSSVGGVIGLLLCYWTIGLVSAIIPAKIGQGREIGVDAKVLIFTLLVSIVTGLIFGIAPALQITKSNFIGLLKEGGRGLAGATRHRLRDALVVVEVALSLVLLIGAGLMINSFIKLSQIDLGFKTDNLLTMRIALPNTKYTDGRKRAAFFKELVQRVKTLPGVDGAAAVSWLPLSHRGDNNVYTVEGQTLTSPDQAPVAAVRIVTEDYFHTMGIKMLSGRTFNDGDHLDSAAVGIISEAMAQTYWPNEDAVGKRFRFGRSDADWINIIGVVKDVRFGQIDVASRPQIYISYQQSQGMAPKDLVVHTKADPLTLATAVRNEVWAIDRDQPISNIRTMDDVVAEAGAQWRIAMILFGIFAGIALILALVGIYGVISYGVSQRSHEIGVRMALGARPRDILTMILRPSMAMVLLGTVLGLGAAFALTRLMTSFLYGVSSTDSVTFSIISILLIIVALMACLIPARRATKIDPMIALRCD